MVQELERQFDATDLSFTKASNSGTTLIVEFISMVGGRPNAETSANNNC